MPNLDCIYLKECFDYNPETGELRWKKRPSRHFKSEGAWKTFNTKYSGKEAGYASKYVDRKYRVVRISGNRQLAHRIIWELVTGKKPNVIDHIDGNGMNNRLSNLRDCTFSQNSKNMKKYKGSKNPYFGVRRTPSNKWDVLITHKSKQIYLGTHDNLFDAICVRKSAEIKYRFHANHGRQQ